MLLESRPQRKKNHPELGGFIGVYFSKFDKAQLYTPDGAPNVAAKGKLFGVDIKKSTINFQFYKSDKSKTLDPLLTPMKDDGKIIKGSLRIALDKNKCQTTNSCLKATTKKLNMGLDIKGN